MALSFDVGEAVDVSGVTETWFPGVVTAVSKESWLVRLDSPLLASTWEGAPRKFDGMIEEVKVFRHDTSLETEQDHIRKRA